MARCELCNKEGLVAYDRKTRKFICNRCMNDPLRKRRMNIGHLRTKYGESFIGDKDSYSDAPVVP